VGCLTTLSVAQIVYRRMLGDCAAGSSAEGNCIDAGALARNFLGEFEENHGKLGVAHVAAESRIEVWSATAVLN
jgi:hypothetical protein